MNATKCMAETVLDQRRDHVGGLARAAAATFGEESFDAVDLDAECRGYVLIFADGSALLGGEPDAQWWPDHEQAADWLRDALDPSAYGYSAEWAEEIESRLRNGFVGRGIAANA